MHLNRRCSLLVACLATVGHAKVSTFEHIGMDLATKPMLAEMLNADGSPKVCQRVWISSIGCADTEQIGVLTAGFGASQGGPKIGHPTNRNCTAGRPALATSSRWSTMGSNTGSCPTLVVMRWCSLV
jgi:hypothetical protein